MTSSGDLDREITIQQNTPSRADSGQTTDSWGNIASDPTPWAQKRRGPSREYQGAGQVNASIDLVLRVNYRTDITRKMRVSFEGDYYDIADTMEIGNREWLDIICTAHRSAN